MRIDAIPAPASTPRIASPCRSASESRLSTNTPAPSPTISPSAAPTLVANTETWLDFTDLVFIDKMSRRYTGRDYMMRDMAREVFVIEPERVRSSTGR